jgi:hypothetical protein
MAPGARVISWEAQAAKKRADTLAKIRPEWRLSDRDLERAREQRDLTGPFIQSFLLPDEVSIVSMESVDIVDSIRHGTLTAVEVTNAFCKTAAIAHQIVSLGALPLSTQARQGNVTNARAVNRTIVSTRSSLTKPSSAPDPSTPTLPTRKPSSARSTAFPSA